MLLIDLCFSSNGVPACANKELLTDITRKEWGFKGYTVSDAGAIIMIINTMTQVYVIDLLHLIKFCFNWSILSDSCITYQLYHSLNCH